MLGSCAPVPIQDLKPLLKELYESVSVSAELNDSDDALVEGLWQGRYQIVVTHQEPPRAEGVFCFPYREEHLSLLAPVGHPLAKLPVIRLLIWHTKTFCSIQKSGSGPKYAGKSCPRPIFSS